MLLLRWVLLPFSLIYAGITWFRNRLYDQGLLKSQSFDLPVVIVGNLAVGGTGKSPMTEHILRIVQQQYKVAVLSRGYGRKTKGFRYVEIDALADEVGDEPLQIKRKFPNNTVAVCENRCYAIQQLKIAHDAILLDDAYQHRQLKPSFAVLLFDYASLLKPIISLPTGDFRDSLAESKRANIIVITKCPETIDNQVRFALTARLAKYSKATLFFSSISYGSIINATGTQLPLTRLKDMSVLLLTGIAKPESLKAFVSQQTSDIVEHAFADHHNYTDKDILQVQASFNRIRNANKIILTTEKDFQRLDPDFCRNYPVFYIPITQIIRFEQTALFEALITKAFAAQTSVN